MSTASRRKYRFADRAAAEDAQAREHANANLLNMALAAIVNEEGVCWFNGPNYQIAVVRPNRMDGGAYVVRYAPGGQRPSVDAKTPDEALEAYKWCLRMSGETEEGRRERDELCGLWSEAIRWHDAQALVGDPREYTGK